MGQSEIETKTCCSGGAPDLQPAAELTSPPHYHSHGFLHITTCRLRSCFQQTHPIIKSLLIYIKTLVEGVFLLVCSNNTPKGKPVIRQDLKKNKKTSSSPTAVNICVTLIPAGITWNQSFQMMTDC